jgi:hypothetical protein
VIYRELLVLGSEKLGSFEQCFGGMDRLGLCGVKKL